MVGLRLGTGFLLGIFLATFWSGFVPVQQAIAPPASAAQRVTRIQKPRVARHPLVLSARTTVLAYPPPPILARAAILEDMRSGRVLYAHNPDLRLPMASTTKIMTALLVIRHHHLHHLVKVSERAATIGESTMELVRGERLRVIDLLYGLLLNSGNDAAVALAEYVGGTVEHFVTEMNAFARRLHLRHTHFATPHGLDAPHHYTSARDLARLARFAMRYRVFRRIVSTEYYHIPATRHNNEHYLGNINHVLYWYPGVNGIKPGQTDAAGLCQVISVNRDGHKLVAVLLNTPNLWLDIRNLLNYGLHDFRWVQAPVWVDGPSYAIAGGSGGQRWIYYVGAGHYIREPFLHYFQTHGGLQTLGYPRTEPLWVHGTRTQYFQGGALGLDPRHGTVYPVPLGADLGAYAATPPVAVSPLLAAAYRRLGGRGVLGLPVTPALWLHGTPMQFYQYGELTIVRGVPMLVPLGDLALRRQGWLPAFGAADRYPPDIAQLQ